MSAPKYAPRKIVNAEPKSVDETGTTYLEWAVGAVFATTHTTIRTASGARYKCILAHTATANDEPAVGANSSTYWDLIAEPWTEYLQIISDDSHVDWLSDGSTVPPTVRRHTGQTGAVGPAGPMGPSGAATAPVSGLMTPVLAATTEEAVANLLNLELTTGGMYQNIMSNCAMKGLTFTNDLAAPVFEKPRLINPANGGSIVEGGKFYYNSSTSGGTGGALTQDLIDLMNFIMDVSVTTSYRYHPSFCIAEINSGTGTSSALATSEGTGYLSSVALTAVEPYEYVTSWYVSVKTGFYCPYYLGAHTFWRNGVETARTTANCLVVPSDGWVQLTFSHNQPASGYNNLKFSGYQPQSSKTLLAMPKMFFGKANPPKFTTGYDQGVYSRIY